MAADDVKSDPPAAKTVADSFLTFKNDPITGKAPCTVPLSSTSVNTPDITKSKSLSPSISPKAIEASVIPSKSKSLSTKVLVTGSYSANLETFPCPETSPEYKTSAYPSPLKSPNSSLASNNGSSPFEGSSVKAKSASSKPLLTNILNIGPC